MNMPTLTTESTIFVAGHRGMVGSAIVRTLQQNGFERIITRKRSELDLCNQAAVSDFFGQNEIDVVVLAAARVGGILANNSYPAQFIYENLMIECNLIHQAWLAGVQQLLFLGSSCIYPKLAPQPMSESALLNGHLEPTNEPYAIAKIAGIKLCESYNRQYGVDYRSIMPTNLYGPNDNFHPDNSHVIPALIRRFHAARVDAASNVVIWGSGLPKREFLHVDDLASAALHVMQLDQATYQSQTEPMCSHLNVGSGTDVTIQALAELVKKVVGFQGEIVYDREKPDGSPRKLMESSKLRALGWQPEIELEAGLRSAYQWYVEHVEDVRH